MSANDYAQPGFRQPSLARPEHPATMTAMGGARSIAACSQVQPPSGDSIPRALHTRSQQNAPYPSEAHAGAPNGYPSATGFSGAHGLQVRQEAPGANAGHPQAQRPAPMVNGSRLPTSESRPPFTMPHQSSLESPELLPARRPSADHLDSQQLRQMHPPDAHSHQQQPSQGLHQAVASPSHPVMHPDMATAPFLPQASDVPEGEDGYHGMNRMNTRRSTGSGAYSAPYASQGAQQVIMRGSMQPVPRQQSLVYTQPRNAMPNTNTAGYVKQSTFSGIMRLLQMGQALTSAIAQPGLAALDSWVNDYFTADAYIRFKLADNAVPIADYEIPSCTLARFYSTLRVSGACSFQLLLDSPSEAMIGGMNTGRPQEQLVQCQSISWIVGYTSGSTAISRGKLRAIFVPTGGPGSGGVVIKMKRLDWSLSMHRELVDRDCIKHRTLGKGPPSAMTSPSHVKKDLSPSDIDSQASPMKEDALTLTNGPVQSRKRTRADRDEEMRSVSPQKGQNNIHAVDHAFEAGYQEVSLPPSIEGLGGLNPDVLQVLETASLMDKLGELLAFSMKQNLGPIDALQKYAELCMPIMRPPMAQEYSLETMEGREPSPRQGMVLATASASSDPSYPSLTANQGPVFPSDPEGQARGLPDSTFTSTMMNATGPPTRSAPLSV